MNTARKHTLEALTLLLIIQEDETERIKAAMKGDNDALDFIVTEMGAKCNTRSRQITTICQAIQTDDDEEYHAQMVALEEVDADFRRFKEAEEAERQQDEQATQKALDDFERRTGRDIGDEK